MGHVRWREGGGSNCKGSEERASEPGPARSQASLLSSVLMCKFVRKSAVESTRVVLLQPLRERQHMPYRETR